MKYCEFCRCNTSDEHKFCPKCGRELKNASGEGDADAALKDIYEKLMAQKLTLSAMYINQANQVAGGLKYEVSQEQPSQSQKTEPVKQSVNAHKNVGFDDFGAIRKYNLKPKGSVLRLIIFPVLALGFFAALLLSFTFSSANEIKGYQGLIYLINDLFNTSVKGGETFAIFAGNISGFKGMLFDSSAYVLGAYAVSSALLFLSMLCTYKYFGFVKTMIMLFLSINLVALIYLAVAFIINFKFTTISLGIVLAAALDIILIIVVYIAYRKKKIKV